MKLYRHKKIRKVFTLDEKIKYLQSPRFESIEEIKMFEEIAQIKSGYLVNVENFYTYPNPGGQQCQTIL